MASLFQQSVWRATHAEERAERDAEHPVVDWLAPLFDSISEVQTQWLRSDPLANPELLIKNEWKILSLVTRTQKWTRIFWGLIHEPNLLSSSTRNIDLSASLAPSVETVTWTWRKLSKVGGHIVKNPYSISIRDEHKRSKPLEKCARFWLSSAASYFPQTPLNVSSMFPVGSTRLSVSTRLLTSLSLGRAVAARSCPVHPSSLILFLG